MIQIDTSNKGVKFALFAYIWWGLAPLFWHQLNHVPAIDIVINRMLTAGPTLAIFLMLQGKLKTTLQKIRWDKTLFLIVVSAVIVSVNWGIFMWAIHSHNVKESSLGYYLSPLVNVVIGILIFGERPHIAQWTSLAVASLGIGYLLWQLGHIPWFALGLASTWGIYSAVRKFIHLGAMEGNAIESFILFPMALSLMLVTGSNASLGAFDLSTDAMLLLAGSVTAIPLIAYIAASKLTTLTTLSLTFYIGPSLQLFLAAFVFDEQIKHDEWIAFGFIAAALLIYTADLLRRYLKQ